MFKVGDKVKLVGFKNWNKVIRRDIGQIAQVIRVAEFRTLIKPLKNKSFPSGVPYWYIDDHKGIIKLGQLKLPFKEFVNVNKNTKKMV